MKALGAACCLAGSLMLAVVAGSTPERDVFVKVTVAGEPTAPDTVLAAASCVIPANVAVGQREVPAYIFSLIRISQNWNDPVHLVGIRFFFEDLNGEALDPPDILSDMRVKVEQRGAVLTQAKLTAMHVTTNPTAGPHLDVRLSRPALISPSESLTVECSMDLSTAVQVPRFAITLDEDSFLLGYENCPSPSIILAHEGGRGTPVHATTTVLPEALHASFTNYPNPFAAGREMTTFAYYLHRQAEVRLRLFTGFGRLVKTLNSGTLRQGGFVHEDITWDGTDDSGARVQNGAYFAVLDVRYTDGGKEEAVRKVAVLR
jgi:hypothetical protein